MLNVLDSTNKFYEVPPMLKFFRFLFVLFAFYLLPTNAFADGAGTGTGAGDGKPPVGDTVDQKLAAALKREEDYKAEIEKLKKPKEPDPKDGADDDLRKKVAKDSETAALAARQTKDIEQAIGFNMKVHAFIIENKDLLPVEVAALLAQADKETYDNAQARAKAVKAALIQSYFALQANVDSITPAQKVQLDEYLKLTKTGKEDRAADIYENIFEPALEATRRIKKAEEVARGNRGFGKTTASNQVYKDRLINIARKTHLGEKTV